ncbi:MAG: methyltransferase domain-containing protein [Pseudomonadales bacterium]
MTANNQEQIDFWNGEAARTWVNAQAQLDAMLAPISRVLIERAAPEAGERAIDVGCGCGDTTLALAKGGAAVWGIDISEPMLERARARAAGMESVAFSRTDAATQAFTADHQLVLSRFGVMFFADPSAAFANLRSALTDAGRLCFVCWQAPGKNPWMAIAGAAVRPYLDEPETPPDPRAPGPFAFADPEYLREVLEAGGFTGIAIEPLTTKLHVADTVDGAMEFLQQVGPLSRVLQELDDATRETAMAAARDALTPHAGPTGLDLGAACWLVTARPG